MNHFPTSADYPGLVCDACGEEPDVCRDASRLIVDPGTGETMPDWYVACGCGETGTRHDDHPAAVVSWEAGEREFRSTLRGREINRAEAPAVSVGEAIRRARGGDAPTPLRGFA